MHSPGDVTRPATVPRAHTADRAAGQGGGRGLTGRRGAGRFSPDEATLVVPGKTAGGGGGALCLLKPPPPHRHRTGSPAAWKREVRTPSPSLSGKPLGTPRLPSRRLHLRFSGAGAEGRVRQGCRRAAAPPRSPLSCPQSPRWPYPCSECKHSVPSADTHLALVPAPAGGRPPAKRLHQAPLRAQGRPLLATLGTVCPHRVLGAGPGES